MPHECTNCNRTFADGSKEMLSGCPNCGGNKFRYRPSGGKLDASGESDDDGTTGVSPSKGSSDADGPLAGEVGPDETAGPRESDEPSVAEPPDRSGVADTVTRATRNLREWVGVDDEPRTAGTSGSRTESPPDATTDPLDPSDPDDAAVDEAVTEATADDAEDAAQASARTSMVEPDELPDGATPEVTGGENAEAGDAPAEDPAQRESTDQVGGDPDLSELRAELNDQFESIKIVEPGQYELNLMELYDRDEYIISLMEDGRYAIEVPEAWRGSKD